MEESEKRRERLRVMRMEASQAEVSGNVGTCAISGTLSNPLMEASATATHPVQGDARAAIPRFDYYTDPVAAYSGNKGRSNADNQLMQDFSRPPNNQIMQDFSRPPNYSGSPMARPLLAGPRNPVMTPPYQVQRNYSPDPRMYQARGGYYSPGPQRSPAGIASPFPMHQCAPEIWNGSGGTASYNFPSNPSPYSNFPSPGFGPTGSPHFNYGQGRPHWHGNSPRPGSGHVGSPSPSSGRGGGQSYGRGMSPGSGHRGGRGQHYNTRGTGPDRTPGPEDFYLKSMEEDPWKLLKPVIWKQVDAPKSWMRKSISAKKPRISEVSSKSSSQPSLAEYLAASFNEAVNEAPDEAVNDAPGM